MKKTYLRLLMFQPVDVDYLLPIFLEKPTTGLLKILFLGPQKNHKINAFGSHLYMNLKKNNFWICSKERNSLLQHNHPIRHIHCQIAASEFPSVFYSRDMLTIIGSRSPTAISISYWLHGDVQYDFNVLLAN